jgi:hypothetical protein
MSYHDFIMLVAKTFPNDGDIRYGQHYFNTLYAVHPNLADRLRGSLIDPFHKEKVPPATDAFVEQEWSK